MTTIPEPQGTRLTFTSEDEQPDKDGHDGQQLVSLQAKQRRDGEGFALPNKRQEAVEARKSLTSVPEENGLEGDVLHMIAEDVARHTIGLERPRSSLDPIDITTGTPPLQVTGRSYNLPILGCACCTEQSLVRVIL